MLTLEMWLSGKLAVHFPRRIVVSATVMALPLMLHAMREVDKALKQGDHAVAMNEGRLHRIGERCVECSASMWRVPRRCRSAGAAS